jgi:hypothetical protein
MVRRPPTSTLVDERHPLAVSPLIAARKAMLAVALAACDATDLRARRAADAAGPPHPRQRHDKHGRQPRGSASAFAVPRAPLLQRIRRSVRLSPPPHGYARADCGPSGSHLRMLRPPRSSASGLIDVRAQIPSAAGSRFGDVGWWLAVLALPAGYVPANPRPGCLPWSPVSDAWLAGGRHRPVPGPLRVLVGCAMGAAGRGRQPGGAAGH